MTICRLAFSEEEVLADGLLSYQEFLREKIKISARWKIPVSGRQD
jgi:hypothetical protein